MQHSDRSYFNAADVQAREALRNAARCADERNPGGSAVWQELAELAGARAKDGRCAFCGHGVSAHRSGCAVSVRVAS